MSEAAPYIVNAENTHPPPEATPNPIATNAAAGMASNSLLMTCNVLVDAPDRSSVTACALLDSASSAFFVPERMAQSFFPSVSSEH